LHHWIKFNGAFFNGTFAGMSDIIRLLPDSVANQIAAGEVVQRPASAVKELLENTVDAGATDIRLIIRDAGKLLIQVTDNGCGMSEGDARMCFERHATSKIQKADDLMAIRTLGFRGEALASIASIAQVELKTRRHEEEIGTCVVIEGTQFKGQTPVNCPAGTSISVKNLFFNVPARRNFLKSNTLELRYIVEEFFRVALVNPSLAFTFYNNDKVLYQLPVGNLKQRIANLFGASFTQRIIPVESHTALVNISGYIGKPEFARKTKGEQYFFTNGRYIRSPYLHHAVESAFRELIPDDAFPSYFLFMEVDPQHIDVNIHPTKTEINFQDIKTIYAILHAAVKQGIGKFTLTPVLDFESEHALDIPVFPADQPVRQPQITINPDYNPFEKKTQPQTSFTFPQKSAIGGWKDFYSPLPSQDREEQQTPGEPPATGALHLEPTAGEEETPGMKGSQVRNSYIVTSTLSGIVIIDQQHAHERILYEKFLVEGQKEAASGQHQLMPQTITLSPGDARLLIEWTELFHRMGFDIGEFGRDSFVVRAIPASIDPGGLRSFIESILEALKNPGGDPKRDQAATLARSLARRLAIKRGKLLRQEEIDAIIESLFACRVPGLSPDGKPTMMVIPYDELNSKLKI